MKRMLLAAIMAACLSGCSTVQSVLGHCELPHELNQKDSVTDLDASQPISPDMASVLWAKDRAHLKKAVDHGNATIDWVAEKCQ